MKGRVGTALRDHGYCYHSVNEAVLKLGDATLFRVSKYFFKSRQSLPGHLSDHLPYIHCILEHSRVAEFWKYFEKGCDAESLRNPELMWSNLSRLSSPKFLFHT